MKIQSIVMAVAIFALGAVTGHAVTSPKGDAIGTQAATAYDLPLELTRRAGYLPDLSADAI